MRCLKVEMELREWLNQLHKVLSTLETIRPKGSDPDVTFWASDEEENLFLLHVYITIIHIKDHRVIGYMRVDDEIITVNMLITDDNTVVVILP